MFWFFQRILSRMKFFSGESDGFSVIRPAWVFICSRLNTFLSVDVSSDFGYL